MRTIAGGVAEVSLEATSYRGVVRELQARFPALTDAMFRQTSVAIDGVMIPTPLLEPVEPDSEVVFVSRITGG